MTFHSAISFFEKDDAGFVLGVDDFVWKSLPGQSEKGEAQKGQKAFFGKGLIGLYGGSLEYQYIPRSLLGKKNRTDLENSLKTGFLTEAAQDMFVLNTDVFGSMFQEISEKKSYRDDVALKNMLNTLCCGNALVTIAKDELDSIALYSLGFVADAGKINDLRCIERLTKQDVSGGVSSKSWILTPGAREYLTLDVPKRVGLEEAVRLSSAFIQMLSMIHKNPSGKEYAPGSLSFYAVSFNRLGFLEERQ